MLDNIKGHVIVVMAPMGSGKGTLVKEAIRTFPDVYETVSCTTRAKRPAEIEGKNYYFLTKEDFEQRVDNGDFLEWAVFGGNMYGTLKSEIIPRLENGETVITEIDLQGVEQLRELISREHMTVVYIEAGGWENLKARALKRASMSEEELESRYQRYLIEIRSKNIADVIIENVIDDFKPAMKEFCELVEKIKCRTYTE